MATSLNDIAIRMSVDADSVEAGFRQARNAAVDFTRHLQKQQDEHVKSYADSFARTELLFDSHVAAHKQMLDKQAAMNAANAAEMKRIAEEKGIYGGLYNEQAALEAQRKRDEDSRKLKESYQREEIDARNNARNAQEIERVKQLRLDKERDAAKAKLDADHEALKAGYRAEEVAAQANAERLADIRRQAANNFMYKVKYGDPYDNPSDRAARRAAMAARQANDQAVLKENNALQQEATALIQKHMTVGERYISQMKRLELLKHTYNIQTGQMMLTDDQFARMKTNLIIQTIRQQQAQARLNVTIAGGFGGMAGAAAQASYAVEDFIQVLSMGGGLNMALMSASNNLSMITREMFGLSSTMGLVAGSVLPLAIIGTVSLISYLMREEDQIDSLREAYERLNERINARKDALSRANQHDREMLAITRQTSVDEAKSNLQSLEDRRLQILKEQDRLLADQADKTREIKDQILSVNDSAGLQQWREIYAGLGDSGPTDAPIWVEELVKIQDMYAKLNQAVGTQSAAQIKSRAEDLASVISRSEVAAYGSDEVKMVLDGITSRMNRITSAEGFKALSEQLKSLNDEQKANSDDLLNNKEEMLKQEQKLAELRKKESEEMQSKFLFEEESRKAQQEEIAFLLRASDLQKQLYQMQKEQAQFVGQSPMVGVGGILGDVLAGQQEQDRIAFLMAQRDALLKEQETKTATPIQGSLVQNAFDAQADAFKQMFEAASKKPDPQVEKTNELLRKIQEAIQNGGVIQVVP